MRKNKIKKMQKYFLIGVPGCGKSTLGQLAADIMKLPFFDTDKMALDKVPFESASDIFRSSFNQRLLNAQRDAVFKLAKLGRDALIATGAEISLMPECAMRMQETGTIIHIKRKPEIIIESLRNSSRRRMVLREETKGTEIDMQEMAVKLYMKEYSQYEAIADLSMDNDGSETEGVQKLIAIINQYREK
jgi:shikimate kinase